MSRALPGQSANGDAWIAQKLDGTLRLAVIDGLGHGAPAAAAAAAAVGALVAEPNLELVHALLACDRALMGTRGAAVSLLWLEPARATFVGIGNVEGRIIEPEGRERRLVPERGIVGRGMRRPRPVQLALTDSDWIAMLYTDGVSSRFMSSYDDFPPDPEAIAHQVLLNWARETDDATIVVARGADDIRAAEVGRL